MRLSAAVFTLLLLPQAMWGQMNRQEEIVRNGYAKLSLLCTLPPLTKAALNQDQRSALDQADLNKRLSDASPQFELSDFKTGNITDIASQSWGQFVTVPASGQQILKSGSNTTNYNDSGHAVSWSGAEVDWQPAPQGAPDIEKYVLSLTVNQAISLAAPQWASVPVTYSEYAAFTVNASYQGRSTGPHKAIFLFGTDAHGNKFIVPNDLLSGGQALADLLMKPTYPSGLLQSRMREIPMIAEWIRLNTVSTSECLSKQSDLCCTQGKCGLSSVDINRDLSQPLP